MRFFIDIRNNEYSFYEITDKLISKKKETYHDVSEIGEYLQRSNMLIIRLDYSQCIFDNQNISNKRTLFTDGYWVWSGDIIHYVTDHNFKLPKQFINNIRELKYHPNKLSDEQCIKIKNRILSEDWEINLPKLNTCSWDDLIISEGRAKSI